MQARVVGEESRVEWDSFVEQSECGHLLQTYDWGEFKSLHGWSPVRVAVEDSGRLVAAAQVLFREAWGLSVAYVPRGPVLDYENREILGTLVHELKRVARRSRSVFLKIEPNLTSTSQIGSLATLGFRPSPDCYQPRRTIVMDITAESDQLLSQMKPKTRYNLRLAMKHGVMVQTAESDDQVEAFYRLLVDTSRRDEFGVHTLDYYRQAWERFSKKDRAALLLGYYQGELVGGIFVMACGPEAIYMYGASSNEHREHMPNYLLQWKGIEWARTHGCTRYDFWGIPDRIEEEAQQQGENQNVRSGLWGVYRFKQGFGGSTVELVGSYDQVYIHPAYWAWNRKSRSE